MRTQLVAQEQEFDCASAPDISCASARGRCASATDVTCVCATDRLRMRTGTVAVAQSIGARAGGAWCARSALCAVAASSAEIAACRTTVR